MPEIIAEVEETIDVTATVAATPGSLTDDYNDLQNHPSINGVELVGNKTTGDLGIEPLPGSITPEMFAPDTQEDMVVGLAKNLLANSGITSSSPYLFRKSPQNVSAELHSLTGATVAWNQLADHPLATSTASGITWTKNSDGSYTVSGNSTAAVTKRMNTYFPANGHVYLFMKTDYQYVKLDVYTDNGSTQKLDTSQYYAILKTDDTWTNVSLFLRVASNTNIGSTGVRIYTMIFDLTQMFGPTFADALYNMGENGVTLYKQLFPSIYPYSAPTLASVQTSARVTRGFNQWDEEWERCSYGADGAKVTSTVAVGSKNYIPILPNTAYCCRSGQGYAFAVCQYDASKNFIRKDWVDSATPFTTDSGALYMTFYNGTSSAPVTTYLYDICINLSDTSRNGQYQPYEAKSYPIDDVVLRGIPKLTNGVLSYDGDIYLPIGEVTRKYAEVDLGSLTWTYNSTNAYFYASMPTDSATAVAGGVNGVCGKYLCSIITSADFYASDKVLTYCNANMSGSKRVFVRDTSYSDKDTFKTAVTGTKLVYELATPTTESADPYTEVQLAGTTEQFVTENYIPVGNESFYPTDLTNVVQNLAPLPTTAGTYKLQVTVSGGVPSYSWVAG